jgi:hypothetical protein
MMVSRQSYQLAFGRASLPLARASFFANEARECVLMKVTGGRDG